MTDQIIIYGTSACPYTNKARVDLDGAIYYDVTSDSSRMDEMLTYSNGARKVPVIVEGDKVTIGYGGS